MNEQIIKLAAGDELARIAKTTQPILGTAYKGVGEMITERLAKRMPQMIEQIKQAVLEEGKADPEELAQQWVAWRTEKAASKASAAKAAAEADRQKADATRKVKADAGAADAGTPDLIPSVPQAADGSDAAVAKRDSPPTGSPATGKSDALEVKRDSAPAGKGDAADAAPDINSSGSPAGSSAAGPG